MFTHGQGFSSTRTLLHLTVHSTCPFPLTTAVFSMRWDFSYMGEIALTRMRKNSERMQFITSCSISMTMSVEACHSLSWQQHQTKSLTTGQSIKIKWAKEQHMAEPQTCMHFAAFTNAPLLSYLMVTRMNVIVQMVLWLGRMTQHSHCAAAKHQGTWDLVVMEATTSQCCVPWHYDRKRQVLQLFLLGPDPGLGWAVAPSCLVAAGSNGISLTASQMPRLFLLYYNKWRAWMEITSDPRKLSVSNLVWYICRA